METRKITLLAMLALSGTLLVGCGDNGESNEADGESLAIENADREPGASVPEEAELDPEEEEDNEVVPEEAQVPEDPDFADAAEGTDPVVTLEEAEEIRPDNPAADNEHNKDAPNPPDVESGAEVDADEYEPVDDDMEEEAVQN